MDVKIGFLFITYLKKMYICLIFFPHHTDETHRLLEKVLPWKLRVQVNVFSGFGLHIIFSSD